MYIPNTAADRRAMLDAIGVAEAQDLFDTIPEAVRRRAPLDLPPALTELELHQHMGELAARNRPAGDAVCFLGGGCYDHFVPAVVDMVGSRSEYYTAYTPYQAEASQGTLQTTFEFQTLVCQLTGMEVSNASLYEAATACVEAAFMAINVTRRDAKVVVSETVHPEYRRTLATYFHDLPTELVTVPAAGDLTDTDALRQAVGADVACVIVQSPNFFGRTEPVADFAAAARDAGALLTQAFDPISLGLLQGPGALGADIAVAEGQPLGNPMSYGGPYLGIFACREQHVRRIPGRIVGETVDRNGKRAFVLTLQTREQHIRREKATSNICSNQGLLALRAAAYLAVVGPAGLRRAAELCHHKAHYAAERLSAIDGVALAHPDGRFFKEFVLRLPVPVADVLPALLDAGFHAGVPLSNWWPDRANDLLVAVTERRTKAQIDAFADALRTAL